MSVSNEKRVDGHQVDTGGGGEAAEPWQPRSLEDVHSARDASASIDEKAGAQTAESPPGSSTVPLEMRPEGSFEDGEGVDEVAQASPGVPPSPARQLVIDQPESAAGLIHAMLGEGLSKEAGVVMVGLGRQEAGELLKHLDEGECEVVSQAVSELDYVDAAERKALLTQFEDRLLAGEYSIRGGLDYARAALEIGLGPRRAEAILRRVRSTHSVFSAFAALSPTQIAPFISHEHPQTIALLLSQLESTRSAALLALLPENMQSQVIYRVATMANVAPQVLDEIDEALQQSLRDIGQDVDVGGPKVAADMLNLTGSSTEKRVLDHLDTEDAEMAEAVRNLMFTFADIVTLTDREIQVLLRQVDQKDLVIALKAAEDDLREKILGNMSARVREFIAEEMEFLGPMRLSEVEEVQLRIVQQLRQLEEEGELTIVRGASSDNSFV